MLKQILAGSLAMVVVLLVACSNGTEATDAAPLGKQAVLEKLANSWNKVSNDQLSVSPMSLRGDERKRFIEKVFSEAGYSYGATLKTMAQQGIDKTNPLHVDMVELVLMPHRSLRYPMDPSDIYSTEELQAVAVIERMSH